MGISGLLPLLKTIQIRRHLDDFRGQTLAVDSYVWLHRGTYTCATELAAGKPTIKYVEYVMQKVRLMRHHGIKPYLVFDGGPLPAKRGTEGERRKKREENKKKGDILMKQGRQKDAREMYCKAVDVTPEMAYQVIKALRAENVDYVVAPYEADAQLAHLERMGLVDGIITEDSDLLVFGCKRVLFKLDPASSTLMSISRSDFGSVTGLVGWNDDQFRAMAILSGCDYLASVNGVGLKTAQKLLRKHKTLEAAVRGLRLEGKLNVPRGYAEDARRAELVFLHQRVFCPVRLQLVHLAPRRTGDTWTPEDEAYVGEDLDPDIARAIARGDFSPVSRHPIVDINPAYTPRTARPLPFEAHNAAAFKIDKGKAKASASGTGAGILSFLIPKSPSKSTPRAPKLKLKPESPRKIVAGRASGKRTLMEAMEADAVVKRVKHHHGSAPSSPSKSRNTLSSPSKSHNQNEPPSPSPLPPPGLKSRFFGGGPSRRHSMPAKVHIVEDEDEDIQAEPPVVQQEDGYVTPSPSSIRFATPDLSSPLHPVSIRRNVDEDEFSSPEQKRPKRRQHTERSLSPTPIPTRILVYGTPERRSATPTLRGPDLFADIDADELPTQGFEYDIAPTGSFPSNGSSTPGPSTPPDPIADVEVIDLVDEGEDDEDIDESAVERHRAVALGWWQKYAGPKTERAQDKRVGETRTTQASPALRRRETTAAGDGGGTKTRARGQGGAGATARGIAAGGRGGDAALEGRTPQTRLDAFRLR